MKIAYIAADRPIITPAMCSPRTDTIDQAVRSYDAIGWRSRGQTLPGVMMGMIACTVPSIFIYGGSARRPLPGKTLTVLDSYEASAAS